MPIGPKPPRLSSTPLPQGFSGSGVSWVYLEWHMRRALAPMLFDDHQRDAAEAERLSPVAKAKVSPAARRKAAAKKTDDGLPVHSFRSLLADLATLTRNTVGYGKKQGMTILAKPTPTQKRALKLLDIKLAA